jgi:hypothetical protein
MDQGRHEVQLMRAELPSISVERAAALADSGRPQLGPVKLKSRTAGIFRSYQAGPSPVLADLLNTTML